MGSASVSLSKPLAKVTKRPERSALGKGCDPQVGEPPLQSGVIQIWKISAGTCSVLYSACRMPVPAPQTWTSADLVVVVFGVRDSGAGAHDLVVLGFGLAFVAETIPVRLRPFTHIGDDVHIG